MIERARRTQLIDATIECVADAGYAGATLAEIAERAGITKAAVLYYFASKDELVREAHQFVLDALVREVAEAVEAASSSDGPGAYIRSMIGHLRDHPRHTRMIIEAMTHGGDDHDPVERWLPLAEILREAHPDPEVSDAALRSTAVIIGGGIDGIVVERLADETFDTAAAAERLSAMVTAGFLAS